MIIICNNNNTTTTTTNNNNNNTNNNNTNNNIKGADRQSGEHFLPRRQARLVVSPPDDIIVY